MGRGSHSHSHSHTHAHHSTVHHAGHLNSTAFSHHHRSSGGRGRHHVYVRPLSAAEIAWRAEVAAADAKLAPPALAATLALVSMLLWSISTPLYAASLGLPWYRVDLFNSTDCLGNGKRERHAGEFALTVYTECSLYFGEPEFDFCIRETPTFGDPGPYAGSRYLDDESAVENPVLAQLSRTSVALIFLCLISGIIGLMRSARQNTQSPSLRLTDPWRVRWGATLVLQLLVQMMLGAVGVGTYITALPEYVETSMGGYGETSWQSGRNVGIAAVVLTALSALLRGLAVLATWQHSAGKEVPKPGPEPPPPTPEELVVLQAAQMGAMFAATQVGAVASDGNPAAPEQGQAQQQMQVQLLMAAMMQSNPAWAAMMSANPAMAAAVVQQMSLAGQGGAVPPSEVSAQGGLPPPTTASPFSYPMNGAVVYPQPTGVNPPWEGSGERTNAYNGVNNDSVGVGMAMDGSEGGGGYKRPPTPTAPVSGYGASYSTAGGLGGMPPLPAPMGIASAPPMWAGREGNNTGEDPAPYL